MPESKTQTPVATDSEPEKTGDITETPVPMDVEKRNILLDKDFLSQNCNYFLTYQFKHVFLVLKKTVSLRRFF